MSDEQFIKDCAKFGEEHGLSEKHPLIQAFIDVTEIAIKHKIKISPANKRAYLEAKRIIREG